MNVTCIIMILGTLPMLIDFILILMDIQQN